MDVEAIVGAVILGMIEGLTEFLPVSSTAHLLLAGRFMGFEDPGRSFEVLIQLGAILAVFSVYASRLLRIAAAAPADPVARRFFAGILLAFLPAALVGLAAHSFIKDVLFESPRLIAVVLILGGVVLIAVDRFPFRARYHNVMELPLAACLGIGIAQCLALVPGVSRAGATIIGALFLGADKRTAAEFSFFLAMPVMAAAFVLDLYKNRDLIGFDIGLLIAIGFAAAFISAVIVVRTFLDYVTRHGFALFGWWRIIVGGLALLLLGLGFGETGSVG